MEKIDTIMENENGCEAVAQQTEGLGYETKYVPTVDLAYEVYERNEKKNTKNFYAQVANKSFDESDFGGFLAKSLADGMFNSVFSIKSTEDFFAEVADFYNPFRLVSTCVKTPADSVEVPAISDIVSGWNDVADAANTKPARGSVLVRNFPIFTKLELPLHFLHRVESHANYVKSILGMQRAKLERHAFLYGDGNTAPKGILADATLVSHDVDFSSASKLADDILEATFTLASEFKHDACFMISSAMQARLAKIKDKTGRYIFDNKTLFGYKVHTLDELANKADKTKDVILFGNFKYGHLVCDNDYSELRIHNLFDKPNTVGLSMPANCGAALVCPEAIVALNTKEVATAEGEEDVEE